MKRIDKLTTAYILTSEDSREAKSYGYKVDTVKVRDGELKLGDLSLESWEFKVADDKLGIKAVAAALGYGMPNVSSSDSEEAKEAYTDWGMKKTVTALYSSMSRSCCWLTRLPATEKSGAEWRKPAKAI